MSSAATIDPLVPPAPKSASGALQIAAATIGNALEWFDILIYGYFATTIAGVFFPNSNPVVSLLLTFGSFGLSYLARPLGAVVLGAYADRAGRKTALALSIRLMVIGTAVMAFMPSYASIGLIAPIGSSPPACSKASPWPENLAAPPPSWWSTPPAAKPSSPAGSSPVSTRQNCLLRSSASASPHPQPAAAA